MWIEEILGWNHRTVEPKGSLVSALTAGQSSTARGLVQCGGLPMDGHPAAFPGPCLPLDYNHCREASPWTTGSFPLLLYNVRVDCFASLLISALSHPALPQPGKEQGGMESTRAALLGLQASPRRRIRDT